MKKVANKMNTRTVKVVGSALMKFVNPLIMAVKSSFICVVASVPKF